MGVQVAHERVDDLLALNVPPKAWRQPLGFKPIFPMIDDALNIAEALQPEIRIAAHLEQAVPVMEMHRGFGRLRESQARHQDQRSNGRALRHVAPPGHRLQPDAVRTRATVSY